MPENAQCKERTIVKNARSLVHLKTDIYQTIFGTSKNLKRRQTFARGGIKNKEEPVLVAGMN